MILEPRKAVVQHLPAGRDRISVNALGACVLEEHPELTWPQVYMALAYEVQDGTVEMFQDAETGISYARRRGPGDIGDVGTWTLANDGQLSKLVDALEEQADDALTRAGGGNLLVQFMLAWRTPLIQTLGIELAMARGRAVESYVAEHPEADPAGVQRRQRRAPFAPWRTNPARPGRFRD